MYPDLERARNRIAVLHDMAERADLAIAIGRARRARQDRSGPAMPARLARATRRMLAPDRAGPAAGQPPARGYAPGLFRTPAGRPGQAHAKGPAARRPQHPEHPNLRPSVEERQNTSTYAGRRLVRGY